jgi:hypothetical protein
MAAKKTKKKTAKKPAGKSDGSKALEFARAYLRKKPKAPFSEIKAGANKKRITIYPITYGRAKALEGLVAVSAYGTKKKTKATRGPGRPKGSKNKRGPGRPRKSAGGLDSIESLVSTIKTLQRERDDALRAIDKIKGLLATL